MILVTAHTDSAEFVLLEAYCRAHSKLWNMFFGWRRTTGDGWAYYKLRRSHYKVINALVEKLQERLDS